MIIWTWEVAKTSGVMGHGFGIYSSPSLLVVEEWDGCNSSMSPTGQLLETEEIIVCFWGKRFSLMYVCVFPTLILQTERLWRTGAGKTGNKLERQAGKWRDVEISRNERKKRCHPEEEQLEPYVSQRPPPPQFNVLFVYVYLYYYTVCNGHMWK